MKKRNLLLFALAAILLTNCKKEEEPIPFDNSCSIATITYNVRIKSDSHPYLKWTDGICVVREIIWDATLAGNTLPTSITHSVITTIDLFTGTATPEIIVTEISPGNYTGIGIGMELQDDGVNDNIILDGKYTHTDGSKIPMRFLFNSGEVFEATLASFLFEAGTNTTCWLELDANGWFSTVLRDDLDNGTLDSLDVMIISESLNSDIYDAVEEQLLVSTTTNGTIVCE